MTLPRWNQRFFSTTRGQVILLLRRASRTVEELAQALGLTDNGVRAHLATLERDGLVRQGAPRRGGGKPASTYGLTTDAERLFPQAYGQVLRGLLGVLSERLSPGELDVALREPADDWGASTRPAAISGNELRQRSPCSTIWAASPRWRHATMASSSEATTAHLPRSCPATRMSVAWRRRWWRRSLERRRTSVASAAKLRAAVSRLRGPRSNRQESAPAESVHQRFHPSLR